MIELAAKIGKFIAPMTQFRRDAGLKIAFGKVLHRRLQFLHRRSEIERQKVRDNAGSQNAKRDAPGRQASKHIRLAQTRNKDINASAGRDHGPSPCEPAKRRNV